MEDESGWETDAQQRQTAMPTVKLRFTPHYSRHSSYAAKRCAKCRGGFPNKYRKNEREKDPAKYFEEVKKKVPKEMLTIRGWA